jgi:hypothetical protein
MMCEMIVPLDRLHTRFFTPVLDLRAGKVTPILCGPGGGEVNENVRRSPARVRPCGSLSADLPLILNTPRPFKGNPAAESTRAASRA